MSNPAMTEPMSNDVLADYERGFAAEGELRGVDACREIRRLRDNCTKQAEMLLDWSPPEETAALWDAIKSREIAMREALKALEEFAEAYDWKDCAIKNAETTLRASLAKP